MYNSEDIESFWFQYQTEVAHGLFSKHSVLKNNRPSRVPVLESL